MSHESSTSLLPSLDLRGEVSPPWKGDVEVRWALPVIGVPGRFEGFSVAKDFPLKC